MTGKTPSYFAREATGLVKQVSTLDALTMAVTGMGLFFVFSGVVFSSAFFPGSNPTTVQIYGLLLGLPITLVYVLLSISISRTGGDYVWVSRITTPFWGFITNFTITVVSLSFVGLITPQAIQWAGVDLFYDLGTLQSNQGYLSLSSYLAGSDPTFWLSVLIVIVTGLLVLANVKLATRIVRYWTIIGVLIGLLFIIVVVSAGPSTFQANFDALSGSTYAKVISAGQQAGATSGVPSALSSASLFAGISGAVGILGFFYPSYFAGELKQVRKNLIISQLGGVLLWSLFVSVIGAVTFFGEGPDFANAVAFLWGIGSSSSPYPTIPLGSGLSMFWTTNPLLVTLFNLAYFMTVVTLNIAIFFTLVRSVFAWSFDRVLPTVFATVNSKTQTPVNATALMIVGGLLFTYVSIYQFGLVASLFSYGTAGIFIAFIIVAIAAIIFPYRRRDIFEKSDKLTRTKLGGIPLISLLGVLSLIASAVVIYGVLLPAFGGATFYTILLEGIFPTFVAGAIIYAIVRVVRRSQGIDLGFIQKEIPPE